VAQVAARRVGIDDRHRTAGHATARGFGQALQRIVAVGFRAGRNAVELPGLALQVAPLNFNKHKLQ
jgi:hypothetical protein